MPSSPLIPCNMLHKRSRIATLKATGEGVYPGKSGLHKSMPAQLKHKRLPPHEEKHLSNGCGGWLYYTAWEICSCRCILGHPYIMHTLLHPQLILLNQGSETPPRTSTQCRGRDQGAYTYWFSASLFYVTQRLVWCFEYRGPSHSSYSERGPVSPVWHN